MIVKKPPSIASIVALAVIALVAEQCLLGALAAEATDRDKIAAGENVYNTRCAVCHGDELVNTGQTFDLRRLKADERPRFENSVRNDKNQMPPWKDVLSDEEIDQLWHYVRAHAYQN